MAPAPGRLSQTDRSLPYTLTPTFGEFMQSVSPQLRATLASRSREVRLSPEAQLFFTTCEQSLNLLAVVAEDAPDSAVVLPVWARIADAGARFDLRVLRDADLDSLLQTSLIDDPETAAAVAEADLPLLLIFDEEWRYLERWGPHPQPVEALLDEWLVAHPEFEHAAEDESPAGRRAYARFVEQLFQEMRVWYNSSMSAATIQEVCDLVAGLADAGDEVAAEFA